MKTKTTRLFLTASTLCLSLAATTSCSDFFDPETDDEFSGEDGFSTNTEMYTGFLGIMTKMQEIGDKEILLTEPRGELIEPADESTSELIALYQYDTDLTGNSYASPQGYYEVIIACNDYLNNMARYRSQPNVDDDAWQALVSSTLRVKVWTYKTLAEIYGEAVWFDDPVTEATAISDTTRFTKLALPQLIDKCLATLSQGHDGVPASLEINWYEWLDPTHTVALANSQYRKWNYIVPPMPALKAELLLWKGAVEDAAQTDATATYKEAADVLLQYLGTQINVTSDPSSNVYWLPSGATPGHYTPIWNYAQPYQFEAVSAIIYDYTNNQTNTLLSHFSNEYPNRYLLRPSEAGVARFLDTQFNPGTSANDTRYKCCFGTSKGQQYLAKFRPVGSSVRTYAYQDDCHIYTYRAMHLHLMLCEALNHLRRFTALNAVLNTGVKSDGTAAAFLATSPEWEGFASTIDPTKCDWTTDANYGTRRYPSMGIRGCFNLAVRTLQDNITTLGLNGALRFNDEALLDEAMLEFAGEGKVYPMMNRLAVRYQDPSIVANRVCQKYTDDALAAAVRAKIMDGAYFIKYDL